MRLLADESVERPVVEALRDDGHDVSWVTEEDSGASDAVVLGRSSRERRVLVTNDKDFAELTFLRGENCLGVLLVRLTRVRSRIKARRVCEVVRRHATSLVGAMTVVQEGGVRRRPLRRRRT